MPLEINSLNYFKLYTNCIPVKGYKQSIIYDLQRNHFYYISNIAFDFLLKLENNYIEKVLHEYDTELSNILIDFLDSLKTKGYGFFCNDIGQYPKLNLEWDIPCLINNAIIEWQSLDWNNDLLDDLSTLGCSSIALISEKCLTIELLEQIKKATDYKRFTAIQIICKFCNEIDFSSILSFCDINKIFSHIILQNTNELKIINQSKPVIIKSNVFNTLTSLMHPIYFNVDIELFTESQHFNTYFNKKIYVNKNREIKNAPECSTIFGPYLNITDLINTIKKPEFQIYWNIKKDIIEHCCVCEYRYMCTDNRIPIKSNDISWYFLSDCNYNPYIARWKHEVDYKTIKSFKHKSILYF